MLRRYRIVLETVAEPLCDAPPGLAPRAAAAESVRASLAAALNDTGFRPEPPDAAERGRRARRIAGMLPAAGAAELTGT